MILGGLDRKSPHHRPERNAPGTVRAEAGPAPQHAGPRGWARRPRRRVGDQGPSLFGEERERIVHRHSGTGEPAGSRFFSSWPSQREGVPAVCAATEGQDTPDQNIAVDRYQSAFLMPKWLLEEVAQRPT